MFPWLEVIELLALESLAQNLRNIYINCRHRSYVRKQQKRPLKPERWTNAVLWHILEQERKNRSIQRTAFERVYFPNSGEAPALSSPLILQLKRDGRWERGADLITVARSFDRESRQVAGFAPLQAVCFNVFGCLIASAGASVEQALGRMRKHCLGSAAVPRPNAFPFSAQSRVILPLAFGYVGAKEICKLLRRQTDGTNHAVAAFCTGAYMARQGGPLPALQAATMLSMMAAIMARGPTAAQYPHCWSPERIWWHCNVINADITLPDNKSYYALRDNSAHKAARRGDYDSSTAAFQKVLQLEPPMFH